MLTEVYSAFNLIATNETAALRVVTGVLYELDAAADERVEGYLTFDVEEVQRSVRVLNRGGWSNTSRGAHWAHGCRWLSRQNGAARQHGRQHLRRSLSALSA